MESCWDFMEWLGRDLSAIIFMRLDHPADLVRLCCVSRSWHRFVITNGLCKKLCLRTFPEVSKIVDVMGVNSSSEVVAVGYSTAGEWQNLEREHQMYTYLCHFLVSHMPKRDCILESISASSTDRYPYERIENTLVVSDIAGRWPSYWSSKGEIDPQVPEALTYRLNSRLCVVDEIKIKPFKATFHYGNPIYSAETVRFRMGHSRYTQDKEVDAADKYVWLYVSPEYPMAQENALQSFKLPRPVICIGGIVQIELMGRVQKCYIDDLYYIGISYVQVIGLPCPHVDILEESGDLVLKHLLGAEEHLQG